MKYSVIKHFDVANGPGIRVSLFVSGCRHACKGCFNEEIWSFDIGAEFTDDTIDEIVKSLDREFIRGLTLLGGEPLDPKNQEWVCKLVRKVREVLPNKTIWCYSGFTYEYITEHMYKKLPYTKELLSYCDVLVDGKFILELLDLKLQFRGSANQRVIDLRKTEEEKKIVWALSKEEEDKYIKV
ncbi:anaerobic ribonucleoside-triphosphate reductase activating protein [Oceanivirga miroungae]|uniref:Anaerobic ribonucleoside-triphosphate reductase-activating protein n=1 Tax=Oceanivirga miroungae TaxID=1130046 RepID=A0A6I8MB19_9FUSO|nr:anaerobic ribonucleoside-triphosphate reductase activating protein [Oceanivirga miroungae]VWL85958.1 anaerobic ribonucleoside-triphosphate reductase activating protein [Oceanivirga miroungae]